MLIPLFRDRDRDRFRAAVVFWKKKAVLPIVKLSGMEVEAVDAVLPNSQLGERKDDAYCCQLAV